MPTYKYFCLNCAKSFEKFHMISETIRKCDKCGALDNLERRPSQITSSVQRSDQAVGEITNRHIEEARHDLEIQKEEMRREG